MRPSFSDTSGNALHQAIQLHRNDSDDMILCELITELMRLRRLNCLEKNRYGQTPFVLACSLGRFSAALQLTHYYIPNQAERTKAILAIPPSVSEEAKTEFLRSLANNLQLMPSELNNKPAAPFLQAGERVAYLSASDKRPAQQGRVGRLGGRAAAAELIEWVKSIQNTHY